MRVAAGVLLIIAAVIDSFGGLFYFGGGVMVGSMDKLAAMARGTAEEAGQGADRGAEAAVRAVHEAHAT
jgi:hypothetical protein